MTIDEFSEQFGTAPYELKVCLKTELDIGGARAASSTAASAWFAFQTAASGQQPSNKDEPGQSLLWRYAGKRISVPGRFKPRRDFIEYHNDMIFQR